MSRSTAIANHSADEIDVDNLLEVKVLCSFILHFNDVHLGFYRLILKVRKQ